MIMSNGVPRRSGQMGRELSSRAGTIFLKIAFPFAFSVAPLALLLVSVFGDSGEAAAPFAAGSLVMLLAAVGAHLYMRDLKRVHLLGDRLLVSDSRRTIEVPLAQVTEVRESLSNRPKLLTVRFQVPTAFGSSIRFLPARQSSARFFMSVRDQLAGSPVTDELRGAVAAARGDPLPATRGDEMFTARRNALASAMLVLGVIVAITWTGVFFVLRSVTAELDTVVLEALSASPEINRALGTPLQLSRLSGGSFRQTGDTGEARISQLVHGPGGDGTAQLEARRHHGRWDMERLVVVIAGRAPIVVVDTGALPDSTSAAGSVNGNSGPLAEARRILAMTRGNWVSFRNFNGRMLIYFTHLVVYRGALAEIRYSVDDDSLSQSFPIEPATALFSPIGGDTQLYLEASPDVRFVAVQVVFKDGTRSPVERFDAGNSGIR
jgi:Cytochrome oxidase complex assembly protein 1